MDLKLFEFVEQFMMDTFFVKINPIWEKGKTFISMKNLIINFHFQN